RAARPSRVRRHPELRLPGDGERTRGNHRARQPRTREPLRRGDEAGRVAVSTIVVAGALANKVGKRWEAWVRLSWAKCLARLGADVHFVEEIDSANCVDASGAQWDVDGTRKPAFLPK